MCIKKLACGLKTVVKEDGRTVLEPIFVEVDCPEDMHRITSKIESCKTVTPKIEHGGTHDDHGSYGGATVNDSPNGNNDSPITDNDSPIGNIDSPIGNNGSPREVVCIETGEVFANARQASLVTGITRQNITACCTGKRKKAGGYQWKYL